MLQTNVARLDPIDQETEEWCVVIETPKGSHNKYALDQERGAFELSGVLPEGMSFPYDFGFIPSTLGDDGDPLDVLLLMDQPAFPGCVVASRLIGVIEAEQTDKDGETEKNDRLLAIPCEARNFERTRSLKDLEPNLLEEIEEFFISYNHVRGKKFKVIGLRGPKRAEALAQAAVKQFKKRHGGRKKVGTNGNGKR
jgi:inorganic pyrophosphatase